MRKRGIVEENFGKEWFGSRYYHLLYGHRDDAEAKLFLDNLIGFLNLKKEQRILDLACGSGRHSVYLAKKGFDVTGIDFSADNIKRAKDKGMNSCFFVGDMRDEYRKKYFNIVFNLFTSFGYFDNEKDDLKVLKSIHKSLKDNGILVLDFMNVKRIVSTLKREEKKTIGEVKFYITRRLEKSFIFKKIEIEKISPSSEKKLKKSVFLEKVKMLRLEDFKKYFDETGFKIKNVFGDYHLTPFDVKKSERLIILAVKKGL